MFTSLIFGAAIFIAGAVYGFFRGRSYERDKNGG